METVYLGSKIYDELNSGNMPSANEFIVQQIKAGKRYIVVLEDDGKEFDMFINNNGQLAIDEKR